MPCPSPRDLPHPGIESASLTSPALVGGFFTTSCCPSVAQLCLTVCNPVNHRMRGLPVLHYLPEFAQTQIHCVDNAIQPSCPLLPLLLLPSIFPSNRVFSNKLALRIRWPKYWNFSISLSNDYSELIFFRRFDFLAVSGEGTFKSPLPTTIQKHVIFST